jgi:hypothetical protein
MQAPAVATVGHVTERKLLPLEELADVRDRALRIKTMRAELKTEVNDLRASIARAATAGARPEDIATVAKGGLSRRLVFEALKDRPEHSRTDG